VARARVSSTARSRPAVHDQHPPAAAAPATATVANASTLSKLLGTNLPHYSRRGIVRVS
jgi:hypothetical protein